MITQDIVVNFTGASMDLKNKVDLLVRPNLGIGDIVLAGVQVKPLSYFTQKDSLTKMIEKHRQIGEGKNHYNQDRIFPSRVG